MITIILLLPLKNWFVLKFNDINASDKHTKRKCTKQIGKIRLRVAITCWFRLLGLGYSVVVVTAWTLTIIWKWWWWIWRCAHFWHWCWWSRSLQSNDCTQNQGHDGSQWSRHDVGVIDDVINDTWRWWHDRWIVVMIVSEHTNGNVVASTARICFKIVKGKRKEKPRVRFDVQTWMIEMKIRNKNVQVVGHCSIDLLTWSAQNLPVKQNWN